LILWLSLASTAAVAADRLSDIPRLKASVVVIADVVRIGDLIENAGSAADVAVFRSPDVGSSGTISSAKVLDAARQNNLLIVDVRGVSDIEVVRDSRVVSARDVEARIIRTFANHQGFGDATRLTVSFDREPRTLYVESTATGDFQVARSSFEPRSGRFDVTLTLPGSAITRGYNLRYTGTITETVEVPVLIRAFNRGEVVRTADISFERRPKGEVAPDTIVGQAAVAGLAARQSLRAGAPLRRSDLVRPEIVKRDENVTIIYEVPGILLTLRGKATESGALGDTISVVNPQTKRVVQAVVSGPGKVTILSAVPIVNTASVNSGSGESE
jgi:flagella basal body P-ring formation protein FlgA